MYQIKLGLIIKIIKKIKNYKKSLYIYIYIVGGKIGPS